MDLVAWTSLIIDLNQIFLRLVSIFKLISGFDWLLATSWSLKFTAVWTLIWLELVFVCWIIQNVHAHSRQWFLLSLIFLVLILLNCRLRIVYSVLETSFAKDLLALIVVYNVYLISNNKSCMLLWSSILFFNDALVLSLNNLSALLLLLYCLLLLLINFVNDDVTVSSLFQIGNTRR